MFLLAKEEGNPRIKTTKTKGLYGSPIVYFERSPPKFSKTSSKAMILEMRRRQRAEAEVRCHWRPWAALHGARGCESASQRMQWIGR